MSPTIRIDNQVFEVLKQHAEPLVDTPNSVLRRLLDMGPGENGSVAEVEGTKRVSERPRTGNKRTSSRSSRPRRRAPRAEPGSLLSDVEYEVPILEILRDNGGRRATREVIDTLGDVLNGRLTDVDRQLLASGDVRWRNRAQFVRLKLIEQGDMVKGSPRGVWEITDQGLARVASGR